MKFLTLSNLLYILFLSLLVFSTEGARHRQSKKALLCCQVKSLKGKNLRARPFHKFCKGKTSSCKRIPGALPQI
ncbi:protein GPR15LG-like [Macrotis lagotis]|uniref:protein GPR15LG-like n=1 Tax=Macrotis lagotis TaxID=92651 RepID=UPI003D691FD8